MSDVVVRYQNETRPIPLKFTNKDGTPFVLTGASIEWVLALESGGGAVATKSTPTDVVITDAAAGEAEVRPGAAFAALAAGSYKHRAEITVGGFVYQGLEPSPFELKADIA